MMTRRALFGSLASLFVGRGVAAACTTVEHGTKWDGPVQFSCTVVGRYSPTHDLVNAGVRTWQWSSNRNLKRIPELLGMRTAFLDWFLKTYVELGGDRKEAIEQVAYVVDAWKTGKRCVVTEHGQEMR